MNFLDQLARANPGDEIVYHVGFHCQDLQGYKLPAAREAWAAYERGDVLLYQRRMGPAKLEYCAKVMR